MVEEMNQHLRTKNFNSFRRQLSLYGFKRLNVSFKNPMFFHPLFRKGRRELLDKIGRAKQAGMKSKLIVDPKLIQNNQNLIEKTSIKSSSETKPMADLLEHIKSLDKFVGWGIVKFMKDLVPLLDRTFPEIKEKLSQDIDEAQKIMYQTHFIKPFQIVNKKEILIKLINGILLEIEQYLRVSNQSPEEKEFNQNLSELNEMSNSFGKTNSEQFTPKKEPIFVEERIPLQLPIIARHSFENLELYDDSKENLLRKTSWSKIYSDIE